MKEIINTARLAKRSQELRKETNPEVVIMKLQSMLKEAINMQASGSEFFSSRALKEIKQIREDLARGQIDGGAKTTQMTAMYGHIIDQMEDINKKAAQTQSSMDRAVNTISKAFPSVDTLVGALMTANPVMGYGVKLFRDIAKARKESKAKNKAEAQKRLAALKEQEALLQKQLELSDAQTEAIKDQKQTNNEAKKEKRRGGIYRPILEEIKKEISELKTYISKVETTENLTYDGASASEQLSLFAQLETEQVVEELAEVEKENADKIVDAIHEMNEENKKERKVRKRKEKLTRVDSTGKPYIAPTAVGHNGVKENASSPFASILGFMRLMSLLGVIGGSAGLLSTLIAPIGALFSFLGSLGAMLLRAVPMLAMPAAIITAIYQFLDGFFNAGEILNKPENQVSITDRIMVGISNLVGSIVRLFDWVAEKLGFDFLDTTDITKKVYDLFMSIPDYVVSMCDEITKTIEKAYDEAVGSVTKVYDGIVNKFSELYNAITGKLDKWIADFNASKDSLLSWAFDGWGASPDGAFSPEQSTSTPEDFNLFSDTNNSRAQAVRSMDAIATQVIQEKARQQTASTVGINAPTANVTSVNNTIMRDRPTYNSNPRYRLALG